MGLSVENVSFAYKDRKVLHNVSFNVCGGRLLCVLGPNGVGKSTLFRCILKLLNGYSGRILVDGEDTVRMKTRELARHIAFIPQSHYPSFNFLVSDMVLMGTTSKVSSISTPGRAQIELAEAMMEKVGISGLCDRGYKEISGGERQLVLIARALAQEAKVLVMDEPTSSLDYGNQIKVLTQVRELVDNGYTVIQSTHHPDQAFLYADEVLALHEGRVLATGKPSDIVDSSLIKELYGVDAVVESLYNDRVRVCIPRQLTM